MEDSVLKSKVSKAPLRQARYWNPVIDMRRTEDGVYYISQKGKLAPYPDRMADRLVHWAEKTPEQLFLADRGPNGEWRKITYGEMLNRARRIGEALLEYNLSPDRPLIILSGNDLEHAQLAMACYYSGVPFAPISPAYSQISEDFSKLRGIFDKLTPGLVYASDGAQFERALNDVPPPEIPIVVAKNPVRGNTRLFSELLETEPTDKIEQAFAAITPDTIVKFMFTSGSTGSPKGVITTNRMLSANQAQVLDCYAFMADEPPVVLDWSPWNHVAGGSKVFNMVLANGGTLYVDDGKPTPAGMQKTIRNLKEVSPTWYFNVPLGYEQLIPAFDADHALRDHFFSRVKMLMYAGAAVAQHTFDDLQRLAVESIGERILVAAGLGASESSPFALMCTWDEGVASNVGLPAKELELKLVPLDGKLEARLRGPNITPGYWKEPELTAKAFDAEGFYNLGDALKFVDPDDVMRGFSFDGRTAENFKLASGTWVAVGALRAQMVNHFGGLIRDVVLTGLNEDYIGALVLPSWPDCRALIGHGADALSEEEVAAHETVRAAFHEKLVAFSKQATGSSNRVRRLLLIDQPLSLDLGEVTEKGSLNQRAVLQHRAALVAEIYAGSDRVIEDR